MTEPLYQLTDLSKRYTRGKESITIFEKLTMTIPAGDFIAIMGPSGSGKTTLLNLLGGIDKPSSGEVVFEGKRIDTMSQGALAKWRAGRLRLCGRAAAGDGVRRDYGADTGNPV